MRQALVPYLRPDDSRKQKCKHPRSKAEGGVEGGVGRLSAAGGGQHWERAALCVRGRNPTAPPESLLLGSQNGEDSLHLCMHNRIDAAQCNALILCTEAVSIEVTACTHLINLKTHFRFGENGLRTNLLSTVSSKQLFFDKLVSMNKFRWVFAGDVLPYCLMTSLE